MNFVYFFSYSCLGVLTLLLPFLDSVNGEYPYPVYDRYHIQNYCGTTQNITVDTVYDTYGYIDADYDGCYNPHSNCSIRLSVSSGFYITARFQYMTIEHPDVLVITEANQTYSFSGFAAPPDSINSTWMKLEFITHEEPEKCLGGFRLYYNSFRYGECSPIEFRCSLEGRCIPLILKCDSYDNCGDWSDEAAEVCGQTENTVTTDSVTAVTPTESANPVYDLNYIQAPCDNSRNFTLGDNGYQRYGIIEADDDACYDPYPDCRIKLSSRSGYYIAVKFRSVAIEYSDTLSIEDSGWETRIDRDTIPPYPSISSHANWLKLQFRANVDPFNCFAGFHLYYTSFHYGECFENEFRCTRDGRCIPNEVICDSYDNCGDWSDEVTEVCALSTSSATDTTT